MSTTSDIIYVQTQDPENRTNNTKVLKLITFLNANVISTANMLIVEFPLSNASIGTPADGFYGVNYNPAGLLSTDLNCDAFDKVSTVLEKLMPGPPPALSTFNSVGLSETLYSAHQAAAPYALLNNVQGNQNLKPSMTITNFGNAEQGVLSAFIKNSSSPASTQGSIALTSGDNHGTYGAFLEVITDDDYYLNQPGKSGFFNKLVATIGGLTNSGTFPPSSVDEYSMQMRHNISGNSNTITFYQDDSFTSPPIVTNPTITSISGSTSYVSGLPVYDNITMNIIVTVQCVNCVKKFYHENWVAQVSSPQIVTASVLPTGTDRDEGSDPTLTLNTTLAPGGVWTNNLQVTVTVQNSYGVQSAANITYGAGIIYLDTASLQGISGTFVPETYRLVSSAGLYPSQTMPAFSPNVSLATPGYYELQLINGQYQDPPPINYSVGYNIVGPNYSSLSYDVNSLRWYTQLCDTITSASYIEITALNTSNFGSSPIVPGMYMYVAIVGAGIGWLDGNSPYPGSGIPALDGAAALDLAHSTSTVHRITFGGALRSGAVIIRFGIPQESSLRTGGFSIVAN